MKTLFFSALLALTLFSTPASFAATQPTISAVTEGVFDTNIYVEPDALKLNVGVTKELGTRVIVKIIDPNGMVISYRQLNVQEVYSFVRFNLEDLEDGNYQLELSDGETTEVKEFEIVTPGANLSYRGILLKP